MDREIPKKPINVKKEDGKICNADCPACGYSFPDIGGINESYGEVEQYNFCPECGQKIDWDDQCLFCSGEMPFFGASSEVYVVNRHPIVIDAPYRLYPHYDEAVEKFKFNPAFCPMCGRKLSERNDD